MLEDKQAELFGIRLPVDQTQKDIEGASSFWLSAGSIQNLVATLSAGGPREDTRIHHRREGNEEPTRLPGREGTPLEGLSSTSSGWVADLQAVGRLDEGSRPSLGDHV